MSDSIEANSTYSGDPTIQECLTASARLLRHAENETDRGLIELYIAISDQWMSLASTIAEHQHA